MQLSQIASYFDDQPFDVYDKATGTWLPEAIKGQLKIADDFVSLFNRSTRRRMLLLNPEEHAKLRDNNVVRVSGLTEAVMLGHPQFDASGGEVYRVTIPANSVRGEATHVRKQPTGPANDPGPLVAVNLGTIFFDLELRTVEVTGASDVVTAGKYFIYMPAGSDVQELDELTYNGVTYRLTELYDDSGFLAARATTTPDLRQTFTYTYVTDTNVFDNNTGAYTENVTTYQITGEISKVEEAEKTFNDALKTKYTIIIGTTHIGFPPRVGDRILVDGADRNILKVSRDRYADAWEVELI
jgi:hypothetical protein